MYKFKFAIIASLAASLALPAAQAGVGITTPVSVYSSSDGISASGPMADARLSADNMQYIGCSIDTYGGAATINCSASDASGNTVACSAVNPPQAALAAVSSINVASAVYFAANTSGGPCTYLSVADSSEYFPTIL